MLWDIETPERFLVKYNDHQGSVDTLDIFNGDGNVIVSGSQDTNIIVYDIRMKQACLRVYD